MSKILYPKRRYTIMRQEIIQAAQQIIQHDGVDGLSMRSIARLVNTSPANLYEYFLNKEEIVLSVYSETLNSLHGHLQDLGRTNDPRADLLTLSTAYVDFIIQDPSQIQIVSHALQLEGIFDVQEKARSCLQSEDSREQNAVFLLYTTSAQGIYQLFLHAIERCIEERALQNSTDMTAHDIAHVMWAFTHGLVSLSLQGISTIDRKIIDVAFASFLDGLS